MQKTSNAWLDRENKGSRARCRAEYKIAPRGAILYNPSLFWCLQARQTVKYMSAEILFKQNDTTLSEIYWSKKNKSFS